MPLKFPLHHYDEAGRLKPPLLLYCFLLFLCRGLVLLIVSLSFREDSSRMMALFYPNKWDFYLSLVPMIPAVLIFILLARRNSLWSKEKHALFRFIPALFAIALLGDIAVQLSILARIGFTFSATHGVSLILAISGLLYLTKSRHMRDLPRDWQAPN
uniref:DUF2919 family protein n=1 Tax=Ningiella ruwaisensis TaxID=2364274 RepID=UPI00109F8670|nr:DUF2919 family protein [Ningiella ruwaisensis]